MFVERELENLEQWQQHCPLVLRVRNSPVPCKVADVSRRVRHLERKEVPRASVELCSLCFEFGSVASSLRSVSACIKSKQIRKMKLKIEQVGKGGLPPLVPSINDRGTAGVNHPSRLVQFDCLFSFQGLGLESF